jgi:hypothetical protein
LPPIAKAANHGNVMLEGSSHQESRVIQILGLHGGRINRLAVDPPFGPSFRGSVGDSTRERPWPLYNDEPANLALDRLIDDALEIC